MNKEAFDALCAKCLKPDHDGLLYLHPPEDETRLLHMRRALLLHYEKLQRNETLNPGLLQAYRNGVPCHPTIYLFDPEMYDYENHRRSPSGETVVPSGFPGSGYSHVVLAIQYGLYHHDLLLDGQNCPSFRVNAKLFQSFWRRSSVPWMLVSNLSNVPKVFESTLMRAIKRSIEWALRNKDKIMQQNPCDRNRPSRPGKTFARGIHLYAAITTNRFLTNVTTTDYHPATEKDIKDYLSTKHRFWEAECASMYNRCPPRGRSIDAVLTAHGIKKDRMQPESFASRMPLIFMGARTLQPRSGKKLTPDEISVLNSKYLDWSILLIDNGIQQASDHRFSTTNIGHFQIIHARKEPSQVTYQTYNMSGADFACGAYAVISVLAILYSLGKRTQVNDPTVMQAIQSGDPTRVQKLSPKLVRKVVFDLNQPQTDHDVSEILNDQYRIGTEQMQRAFCIRSDGSRNGFIGNERNTKSGDYFESRLFNFEHV